MEVQEKKKSSKSVMLSLIIGFSIIIFLAFIPFAIICTYIFFLRPFQISGNSMYPNFKNGQYYMSNIQHENFNRGDVVVFKAPDDTETDYIKRVIAIPGETVMLENGSVYVNHQPLDEDAYLDHSVNTYVGNFMEEYQTVTVPKGKYFVLGDNRQNSSDSREYGFVPQENIIGKILFCYWKCK